MGTSKYVALSLIVVLAGMVAAGQDQPAASSKPAQQRPSDTRQASCLVRIAVDPAVMPLSQDAVSSLIHSPAVLLKAAHDVLSVSTMDDLMRPNKGQGVGRSPILVRWLNTSMARMPWDRPVPNIGQKGEVHQVQPGGSSPAGSPAGSGQGAPAPNDPLSQERSGVPDAGTGGAAGGIGGMGMGGSGLDPRVLGEYGMGGYGYGPIGGFLGTNAEPTALVELQVNLPDTVPPRADEFLKAVVKNLQDSLMGAYNSYRTDLRRILLGAKDDEDYEFAQSRRDSPTGPITRATMQIRKQLDTEVDLSPLNRQMPLAGAIDALRKAVEPPLNIVVLWKDLRESLAVEPTSPINIDGMPRVKLGTMLDLLVKGLNPGDAKAIWRIKDEVIVIGTTATLGQSLEVGRQPQVETDPVNLGGQRSELVRKIQALELDLAGMDARREAIGAQIAGVQQRVNENLSQDPVAQELEKLAQMHSTQFAKDSEGRLVGRDTSKTESAIRARIELANRREEVSKQVGGSQLEEFNRELSRLAIDKAEKEAQLQIVRKQLDEVQKQLAQALTFDPEAARLRLAQESLDIAARRVTELQTRLANLQPPMVTMIGAN